MFQRKLVLTTHCRDQRQQPHLNIYSHKVTSRKILAHFTPFCLLFLITYHTQPMESNQAAPQVTCLSCDKTTNNRKHAMQTIIT